ncbi:MAG: SDR family NAD(P)-dependent oxidoreductase, partial [Candidatus Aminicenantia bacterium]
MLGVEGKVALITGASRGIGAETAIYFARAGANVILNFRTRESDARRVAESVEKEGVRAILAKADITIKSDVEEMIEIALKTFGKIDILVNNAGIWTYGEIGNMPEEVWDETMNINLKSVYLVTNAVVPTMKERRYGRIINVSSTAGVRGEAFHSHYAATKGALISFTKSLAVELAPFNILVNAVAPGWVDTEMSAEPLSDENQKREIISKIPLKKVAKVEEIAGPILFLASDLATHITGEVLNVNGGSVLCG